MNDEKHYMLKWFYCISFVLNREQQEQLEKLKSRLKMEVDLADTEEKCLHEYNKEMECLSQEKMAHVEELRQIHADMNAMEQVVKQSQEERNRHLEVAKNLNMDFVALKNRIDKMRTEIGLPRLPEQEMDDKLRSEFFDKLKVHPEWQPSVEVHHSDNAPLLSAAQQHMQHFAAVAAAQRAVQRPTNVVHHPAPAAQIPTERPVPSAFRQQPPPMKSCLSCHQQIHRNAPICPLCKAKSRSRNPKKPKRKLED